VTAMTVETSKQALDIVELNLDKTLCTVIMKNLEDPKITVWA